MPWFWRTKQEVEAPTDAATEGPGKDGRAGQDGREGIDQDPPVRAATDPHAGAAVAGVNALSAAWARLHGSGDDTAFSGLGCWVLLALLSQTATGTARSELEAATGLPADRGMQGATAILDLLGTIGPLRTALGIWSRVVLDPEWVQGLPAALVGGLGDDAAENQRRIDGWVREATDGELTRLPLEITNATVLLLVSALVLRVDWIEPFREADSFLEGAWAGKGVPRLVAGTSDLDRLRVADTDVGPLTLLRVPTQAGIDVHLVRGDPDTDAGAVLGAGIEALGAGVEALDATTVPGSRLEDGEPAPGVRVRTIEATEPGDHLEVTTAPFDIRASHDLLASPSLFGLTTAMDTTRGHFPGLSPTPLAVEKAQQDVVATFNRTGFHAAAVTAVAMRVGSARPPEHETHRVRRLSVTFDEPFGFVATHRASSLVIVAGWVHDPAATDGSPDQPAPS